MVIDYLIVNINCKKIVDSIMIGEKVDADYMPLILEVRRNRKKKWKGRRELKRLIRIVARGLMETYKQSSNTRKE